MPTLDEAMQALGLEPGAPQIAVPPGHHLFTPNAPDEEALNSQSFSVANGAQLDVRLGFVVGSCVVDNNTSSFMNIPDATKDGTGRWVPPGFGAAIPILGHISRARVNWSAPPGHSQPAGLAGETAQVIFFASPVPPGFGFAAPSNQTLPWLTPNKLPQAINNFTVAAGSSIALVAAITGQTIYLFGCTIAYQASPASTQGCFLEDSNLNVFHEFETLDAKPNAWQGFGCQLTNGLGLALKNNTAGAIVVQGSVVISQA